MALAIKAQVARVLGRRDYLASLDEALALPQPELDGWLHLTPRYQAARFAVFDDRLEEARADLFRMLALVERGERRGAGRRAAQPGRGLGPRRPLPGRARLRRPRASGSPRRPGCSPGPAWYTGAVAELAGGTLARASPTPSGAGGPPSRNTTAIHLGRNLHALGQVLLRSGDARAGVETLRRIRALEQAQGLAEPTMLRWHSDLASGLVAIGEHDEAEETIRSAREAIC